MNRQQQRLLACTVLFVAAIATSSTHLGAGNGRQRADDRGVAALEEIGAGRSALPLPDQVLLVQQAIGDTDLEIRVAALNATLGRAAAVRFAAANRDVPTGPVIGSSELPQLRPFVVAALTDGSARVRLAAVMALGNMDLLGPAARYDRQRLDRSTSSLLYQVFNVETDRAVRFEIVKAFALAGERSQQTRDVVARTLDDPDDGLLQYPIMGVGTLELPELLPRVVPHLQHPNPAIRMAAATTTGRFAEAGTTYRQQLQEALALEKMEEIRQVLQGTLSASSPARPGR